MPKTYGGKKPSKKKIYIYMKYDLYIMFLITKSMCCRSEAPLSWLATVYKRGNIIFCVCSVIHSVKHTSSHFAKAFGLSDCFISEVPNWILHIWSHLKQRKKLPLSLTSFGIFAITLFIFVRKRKYFLMQRSMKCMSYVVSLSLFLNYKRKIMEFINLGSSQLL